MICKCCGGKFRVCKTEDISGNIYRVRQCRECGAIIKTSEENPSKEEYYHKAILSPKN